VTPAETRIPRALFDAPPTHFPVSRQSVTQMHAAIFISCRPPGSVTPTSHVRVRPRACLGGVRLRPPARARYGGRAARQSIINKLTTCFLVASPPGLSLSNHPPPRSRSASPPVRDLRSRFVLRRSVRLFCRLPPPRPPRISANSPRESLLSNLTDPLREFPNCFEDVLFCRLLAAASDLILAARRPRRLLSWVFVAAALHELVL
jgi:hypothetical protein